MSFIPHLSLSSTSDVSLQFSCILLGLFGGISPAHLQLTPSSPALQSPSAPHIPGVPNLG
jgi:hypothetical protein